MDFDSAITVKAQGHSEGIALLWRNKEEVQLIDFLNKHINVKVCVDGQPIWRLVGMYGAPNRSLRHNTWRLIKHQAEDTHWPWAIIRDINNVTS
ncbi:hypothetical protein CsatB_020576 [Cannabis sativa]